MQQISDPNKKKVVFKLYQNIALGKSAQDRLYEIWKEEKAPAGITLTEDDYTSLALALAVRDYPVNGILEQQLTRIKNPDRQKRLRFMMPALSAEVGVRDAFFASLKEEENRDREVLGSGGAGVPASSIAGSYLAEVPARKPGFAGRNSAYGRYLLSIGLAECDAGFLPVAGSRSVVRDFLEQHPDYNPRLKAKLLQAADNLFRAERILN